MLYANNKSADQSAHARSLVSAIVIRSVKSMLTKSFNILANVCSVANWLMSVA